jgi:hypothetical protein
MFRKEIFLQLFFQFSSCLGAFVRHIDTIQEFSVILVSNVARLRNLSASKGKVLVINSFENDFVLEFWAHFADAAWEHFNLVDLLSTQEVLNFNTLAVFRDRNVDGEVSVHQSHLISVTLHTY